MSRVVGGSHMHRTYIHYICTNLMHTHATHGHTHTDIGRVKVWMWEEER